MGELNARAGREIHALRKRRGCTLGHVAVASGLSRTYLSEVENGKANLTIGTLERIAQAFNVDPLMFLGGDASEAKRRAFAEGRLERIRTILDEGE